MNLDILLILITKNSFRDFFYLLYILLFSPGKRAVTGIGPIWHEYYYYILCSKLDIIFSCDVVSCKEPLLPSFLECVINLFFVRFP